MYKTRPVELKRYDPCQFIREKLILALHGLYKYTNVFCVLQGDGGNPLVCTLSITINPTLFGLVSGGTPGKDRDGYSFFTRLSSYRDWITTNA